MESSRWGHGGLTTIPDYVRRHSLRKASLIDHRSLHSGTWVRNVPVDAEGTVAAVTTHATPSTHGSTCTFLLGDVSFQTFPIAHSEDRSLEAR